MAKQETKRIPQRTGVAAAELTGNAGGGFEAEVGAYCLALLLRGTIGFGGDLGRVESIRFQTMDLGRRLDDLSVNLICGRGEQHQLDVSVKRDRQVTSNGFPPNFVTLIWQHWLSASGETFRPDADAMMLAVGQLGADVEAAWNDLLREAVAAGGDESRLIKRWTSNSRVTSSLKRNLFKSLHCPKTLLGTGQSSDPEETARLIRSLRLKHFDFRLTVSRDSGRAIEMCREALASGDLNEAKLLWDALISISQSKRQFGGTLDLPGLLRELRHFQFKDFPNFEADWRRLLRYSEEQMADVRENVGGKVSLLRLDMAASLQQAADTTPTVIVVGDSGSGKSSLAKQLASHTPRTVWLTAEDFNQSEPPFLEQQLQLQHDLLSVLNSVPCSAALLVVDGAERLTATGVRRVATIIEKLAVEDSPWRVFLTSQPERLDVLLAHFATQGILSHRWRQIDCELPAWDELTPVFAAFPSLRLAASRPELQALMRNLKVLDWLAIAVERSPSVDTSGWAGVTDVIEWIWTSWIGNGPTQFARGGLLKKLATIESQSLVSGVPLSDLTNSELQTLFELVTDQLVVPPRDERVRFEHDLLGDWARVLILIEGKAHLTDELLQKSKQLRWQRAVKLFGQWLLERDRTADLWRSVISQQGADAEAHSLMRDLLLESAMCAANAEELLERLWPVLASNHGELLGRLLQRFLHVATVPNTELLRFAEDENQALMFAAHCRLARRPYWAPMVTFLHRHRLELMTLAPVLVSKVCQMWLTSWPAEFSPGHAVPLRRECAEIALLVGREFQAKLAEGTYFQDDEDEPVFAAALESGRDLPDDVSQFALELACRRDESPDIAKRRAERQRIEQERIAEHVKNMPDRVAQMPWAFHRPGPLRNPWPDGPAHRIAESFQKVCLNTASLQPLIAARPEAAKEIILANCIEGPTHEDPYGNHRSMLDQDLGLDWFHEWSGPIYFRGPFLHFLRVAPEHAIDLIVRLTNFATERWKEWVKRDDGIAVALAVDDELCVSLMTPAGVTQWLGDLRVYGWHRGRLINRHTLVSALMALEKWLCDQTEASHDITQWAHLLFERSRSVAILGVLASVAKKHPELLLTSLQPMLTAWQIYAWDHQVVLDEAAQGIGFFVWTREGEQIFNTARDWTFAEHRKQLLLPVVIQQLLLNDDVQQFFARVRALWHQQLEQTNERDALERLIARFDPANYQPRQIDDQHIAIELVWPEHLREACEAGVQEDETNLAMLGFPLKCRQLLDSQQPMASEKLDEFWGQLHNIAKMLDRSEPEQRAIDAVAGGVTVLGVMHNDWLSADEAREQQWANLLTAVQEKPLPRREFDCRESITNYGADNFLGELFVTLLADDPSNRFFRAEVAGLLMSYHYETAYLVMRTAFRLREELGDDFGRLQNLAVMYAGLSYVQRLAEDRGMGPNEKLGRRVRRLWQRLRLAFVECQIPSSPIAWDVVSQRAYDVGDREWRLWYSRHRLEGSLESVEADSASAKVAETTPLKRSSRRPRKAKRRHPGMDIQYLPKAFEWLPQLNQARNADERQSWIQLHRNLLSVTLATIEGADRDESQDIDGTPYPYDNWVFDRIAGVIAQMSTDEQPEQLWHPIVELGPQAHYWVESFLGDWINHGSRASPSPEAFASRWAELIAYFLDSPQWQAGRHFRCSEVYATLLGFDIGKHAIEDAKFANAFRQMEPLLGRWAETCLDNDKLMAGFARFLVLPSASGLLIPGVKWIAATFRAADLTYWHDDVYHYRAAVVELLARVWSRHKIELVADLELRRAFEDTLNLSVRINSAGALQLQDEVMQSLTA